MLSLVKHHRPVSKYTLWRMCRRRLEKETNFLRSLEKPMLGGFTRKAIELPGRRVCPVFFRASQPILRGYTVEVQTCHLPETQPSNSDRRKSTN